VVVGRKKQNWQLKHRNLYLDSECGSAESTTRQRPWKADGFEKKDDELGTPGKFFWWSVSTTRAGRNPAVTADQQ
jgi:hypothetical protein